MMKKLTNRKMALLVFLILIANLPVQSQSLKRSCIPVYCAMNVCSDAYLGQTAGQPFCTLGSPGSISALPGFQQAIARAEILIPMATAGYKLNVYPNPASHSFEVRCEEPVENSVLQVFNLEGTMLLTKKCENLYSLKIDCSDWPNGLYLIRISDQFRKSTFKISVNR